jgi:uroporphyrinogen-III synthase
MAHYNKSEMPLRHKRILITRTRHQASDLAGQLEALGAIPILIPTIEIVSPESYASLDEGLARLESYDWLIFTSANAVEVFQQRRDSSVIPRKIAVIGPATARAVKGIGLQVDLIPPKYIAESLSEALLSEASGKSFLLIRAAEARDTLPEALVAAGANVTIAEAYRNQIPFDSVSVLQSLFSSPEYYPDAITFTSASTARNLKILLEAAGVTLPVAITLASIGPITSQALRDLGLHPTIEAAEPTISSIVQSLTAHFSK